MPCTTVLVGRKASHDGSTMIARTDDGFFDVKKMVVVTPDKQPRKYTSTIGHLTIDLPDDPMRYTACPSVDGSSGIWAATGINEANVGMTATETITTNARVLAADPLVTFRKARSHHEKNIPGGIGEEDLVVLVLPYIRSAREGVLRLGSLLEEYGTYESNGIAFNDEKEVWWLETIGGHHWIARRVKDKAVVLMPNQFGMDGFDFKDAYGDKKENLCSADLKEFIEKNHLDLNSGDDDFNPRWCFGSHLDRDHIYNTPRAWFMGRCLAPTRYKWDGPDAQFTPESDDLPWSIVPEKKVTPEMVKYLLSSHYQGTPYDPYRKADSPEKGLYRPIGINRTGVTSICQIRPDMPEPLKGVEWIIFGPTTHSAMVPVYTQTDKLPAYLSDVTLDVSTDNLYWCSRLINALTDANYGEGIIHAERYQEAMGAVCRQIMLEYDRKMIESGDFSLIDEANKKICAAAKAETQKTLNKLTLTATQAMKCHYNRGDH